MPIESIQLGVLTSAPFLAATWHRLFTPPLEALEVAIAIRVNVAVSLACIAPTVASIPAKRLKAGIICGNGGEGEERSGQRQESEGRAPPTELHLA